MKKVVNSIAGRGRFLVLCALALVFFAITLIPVLNIESLKSKNNSVNAASLPIANYNNGISVGTKVLFAATASGTQTSVVIYDFSDNTLTVKTDLPTMHMLMSIGSSATVVGTKIIFGTGTSNTATTAVIYDSITNTFTLKSGLPAAYYLAGTTVNTRVIFGLGTSMSTNAIIYDSTNDTFTTRSGLTNALYGDGAVIGTKAVFNTSTGSAESTTAVVYDFATNAFSAHTGLTKATYRGNYGAVLDSVIVFPTDSTATTTSLVVYNPSNNNFTSVTGLSAAYCLYFGAIGTKFVSAVGSTSGTNAAVFDSTSSKRTSLSGLPSAYWSTNMATNNKILFAVESSGVQSSVVVYNAIDNTFTLRTDVPSGLYRSGTVAGQYIILSTVSTVSDSFIIYNSSDDTFIVKSTLTTELDAANTSLSYTTTPYNNSSQIPELIYDGKTLVNEADYDRTISADNGNSVSAGVYVGTVTITYNGKGDYEGTFIKSYTITKVNISYTTPTGLTAKVGQTLSQVALPTAGNGVWSWTGGDTTSVGAAGTRSHNATLTPTDTRNYNTLTNISVSIAVSANTLLVNFEENSSAGSRVKQTDRFAASISIDVNYGTSNSFTFDAGQDSIITSISLTSSGATAQTFTSAQFATARNWTVAGQTVVVTPSVSAGQITITLSNIPQSITITATTENKWQVECIDEHSGSTFVGVATSYAALADPPVVPGKTFVGWFSDKGEQVTAATAFSNISNWDSVERITRVYARWI